LNALSTSRLYFWKDMRMRTWKHSFRLGLLASAIFLSLAATASAFVIDWVTVGAPGNAPQSFTGLGAVATTFRISKTEITNVQYARFLNDVAASDPNAVYNLGMSNDPTGGIIRSGFVGNWSYSAKVGRENWPVDFVTFYSALRFANWLHNGQPVGPQDTGTTEDGAYTITAAGIMANSIVRNPGAKVFIPSVDEWYKAAFYDAASASYYDNATGPNVAFTSTQCALPGPTLNTGNCLSIAGNLTPVGSYTGSPSPNGTFDQAGNVDEWNETIFSFGRRGKRGGTWSGPAKGNGTANSTGLPFPAPPFYTGIRVASTFVPEPAAGLLQMAALFALGLLRRLRSGWGEVASMAERGVQ